MFPQTVVLLPGKKLFDKSEIEKKVGENLMQQIDFQTFAGLDVFYRKFQLKKD